MGYSHDAMASRTPDADCALNENLAGKEVIPRREKQAVRTEKVGKEEAF